MLGLTGSPEFGFLGKYFPATFDTSEKVKLYIHVTARPSRLLFNNQPDALIIQIYSVMKLYMFRTTSLLIIRSFLLYIRHW